MRYFILAFMLLGVLVVALGGFRGSKSSRRPLQFFNDMDTQAKLKYQRESSFFANRTGARALVPGTLPMGYAVPDKAAAEGGDQPLEGFALGSGYLNTGRMGDYWGNGIPSEITVDEAFLSRGRARYNVYCIVCHGASGNGQGILSKYGLAGIADLHQLRLRDARQTPDGDIYSTLTNGKGQMGPYGTSLTLRDRWAVVAYLRVLQTSRRMPLAEVEDEFNEWQKNNAGQGEGAAGKSSS